MPPPVDTQERRRISPRYSALQKPWVVAPQINNPSHDASTVQISRRDFLKASGAALGGLALAAISPQTARALDEGKPQHKEPFVYSMRERLSTASQEFLQNHNIRTICYEGRTLSIDDPAIADDRSLANHFDSIVNQLRSVELSGQKPNNVARYKGDITPNNIFLNFDKVTFSISLTDDKKYITQTTIGKVGKNGIAETEGLNILETRKSLMVSEQGNEQSFAWFDNVRSKVSASEWSEIVVNAKQGTVFQVTHDENNIIQTAFSGIRGKISIERLNWDNRKMELCFLPTAPAFLKILTGIKNLIRSKNKTFSQNNELDLLYEQVFSPRAKPETRLAYFKSIGISNTEFKNEGLGVMDTLYATDFPTTMDMSLKLMGAYRYILELVNSNKSDDYLEKAINNNNLFYSLVPQEPIPVTNTNSGDRLKKVTDSILKKEILLPFSIPQIRILQVRNNLNPTKVKQVLVAQYAAGDMSVLNSLSKNVSPGASTLYIADVDGTDPMTIFNHNSWLNNYDKEALLLRTRKINSEQFAGDTPSSWSSDSKLYGWTVDTAVPAVEIRTEHVRLYYDPASNDSRLFAGIELPQIDGAGTIVQLRPGSMKGSKYSQREKNANRTVGFTINYPYSVLDVTDKVIELRKKGFTTASQFGFLSPPEAAEMVYGLAGTKINYTNVESFLGEQKNAMIQYGNPGGPFDSAKSILIAQTPTNLTRYTLQETGGVMGLFTNKKYLKDGNVSVQAGALLRAYEIIMIDGKKMVVVAQDENNSTIYAVPIADMQFVGVESNLLVDLQNAILATSLVWGGSKIISLPGAKNVLETLTKTLLKSVIGK